MCSSKAFLLCRKLKASVKSLVSTAGGCTLAWKKRRDFENQFREPYLCLLPLSGSTAFICDLLKADVRAKLFFHFGCFNRKWNVLVANKVQRSRESLEAAVFHGDLYIWWGGKGLQQRICFLLISVGACSCNDWAYVIFCSAWTYWFHSLNCLNAFMQWNVNMQLFISEMWFTPTKVKPCYNSALG